MGGEGGPAGLMAGAAAATVVPVEILIEEHEVFPIRARGVTSLSPVTRRSTVGIGQEDGQLLRPLGIALWSVDILAASRQTPPCG
jgi:hypothetical protein